MPRYRFLRWLSGCDRTLPEEVMVRLSGGAIMHLPLLLAGMTCTLIAGVAMLIDAPSPFMLAWVTLILALMVGRVLEYRWRLKRAQRGQSTPVDGVLILALLWALSLGGLGAYALVAAPPALKLVAIGTLLVVSSSYPALCIGRPRLSVLLVLLADVPLKLAVPFQAESAYWIFVAQGPIYWLATLWFSCYLNGFAERALLGESRSRFQAEHDHLTGLHNRPGFYRRVDELRRSVAGVLPATLYYIDLDGFKQINDHQGHEAGDALLVDVARLFQQVLRQQDIVVRWGGDEFLLLLPGASEFLAADIAERLLTSVKALGMTYPGVGMSMGIAREADLRQLDAERLVKLIDRADAALYQAKRAGKGRYRHAC
ncbi:GGDEF domain-containing protein [Salinicola tamaricis]|uniref:GGDEF domain-containing protein n=1 Tax=Salinicola tamaricis TaxID=1771309 RepID=UPI0013ED2BAD|nr:GGDEF domain-containing protein [Salinicola tamaricis]